MTILTADSLLEGCRLRQGGKGAVHAGVVGRPDAAPALKNPQESIENSIGMKLKRIPADTFQMGSSDGAGEEDERPQHEVRITRPFYLGVTEVSQAQYEAVMGNNPSRYAATGDGKDMVDGQSTGQHPVEKVSWLDAVKFCNKLSEMEGRKPFYEINGERSGCRTGRPRDTVCRRRPSGNTRAEAIPRTSTSTPGSRAIRGA